MTGARFQFLSEDTPEMQLWHVITDYSQQVYFATWFSGVEAQVWHTPGPHHDLARRVGAWLTWPPGSDSETWVPLEEWVRLHPLVGCACGEAVS